MNSPALTKTRAAVSALMATATLATAGLATSLAIARHDLSESTAAPDTTASAAPGNTVSVGEDSNEHVQTAQRSTKHRTSKSTTGFAPTQQAGTTSSPSHTRTKGS